MKDTPVAGKGKTPEADEKDYKKLLTVRISEAELEDAKQLSRELYRYENVSQLVRDSLKLLKSLHNNYGTRDALLLLRRPKDL